MVINRDKLEAVLVEYKKDFLTWWPGEKYKWEAVKRFQDNWDLDAPDFAEMFERATTRL